MPVAPKPFRLNRSEADSRRRARVPGRSPAVAEVEDTHLDYCARSICCCHRPGQTRNAKLARSSAAWGYSRQIEGISAAQRSAHEVSKKVRIRRDDCSGRAGRSSLRDLPECSDRRRHTVAAGVVTGSDPVPGRQHRGVRSVLPAAHRPVRQRNHGAPRPVLSARCCASRKASTPGRNASAGDVSQRIGGTGGTTMSDTASNPGALANPERAQADPERAQTDTASDA